MPAGCFLGSSEVDRTLGGTFARREGLAQTVRVSYGTGLRVTLDDALVIRFDVGFSNEETALVYLDFGQTF